MRKTEATGLKLAYTTAELAALYGCSRVWMWRMLSKAGLIRPGRQRIPLAELLKTSPFAELFESMRLARIVERMRDAS